MYLNLFFPSPLPCGPSTSQPVGLCLYTIPKKDEGRKETSQASLTAANNNAILATISSQGVELTKICTLVDDLKKWMEGRLDSIEAGLSALQKEHREAAHRLDDMDEALSAADSRITLCLLRLHLGIVEVLARHLRGERYFHI